MSTTVETPRLQRLTLGFMGSCVAAVGLYGVLRIIQSHLFAEPNPATVIWSPHAGYYWRCWTVSYAGVMCGFIAYGAAGRSPERVARGLVHALSLAVAILVYQGLFVP